MKPIDQTIAEAIDATFMQRGFNARRHAEAVLQALDREGWIIVPADWMRGSGRSRSLTPEEDDLLRQALLSTGDRRDG
jgi:hypothetical protein